MGLFNWLFGKKSSAHPDDPLERAGWQKGQRVLAAWQDSFFYPGRIRQLQGDNCEIAFDDGDVAWVHEANVRQPDIRAGSQVFCRYHAGPMYLPGTVEQQNGEKIQVKYENGEKEWTTISMVRVSRGLANVGGPPAQRSQGPTSSSQVMPGPALGAPSFGAPNFGPSTYGAPGGGAPNFGGPMTGTMAATGAMVPQPPGAHIPDIGDPVTDSDWRVGDRVLGRWFDFFWYPATILAIGTKGYHLLFDDGDQRLVTDIGLMPLGVEEGEELYIRPKNQPQRIYTPARVVRAQGETIDVELDDGTQEINQKLSRARFWRCPVGIRSLTFDEGDRVWAQDVDGFTYPAEILSIDGDKVITHFLDGPERMLTPELVRPFDLQMGATVDCRWKGGQVYFRGQVSEREGDRVHIHYDDGDREWTTVRLVRLVPK